MNYVETFNVERVERITGVPGKGIIEAATVYGENKPGAQLAGV